MKLTNILFAAALLSTAAISWSQQTAGPDTSYSAPGLVPGDQVNVHLFDFPEFVANPLSLRVNADGSVHLPYAGTIQARGMSTADLEQAIVKALQDKGIVKQPNVTVDVMSAVNLSVGVMGQVQQPKSVPLYAPAPVSYVLSQAGGFSNMAARHLTIIHPDAEPTSLDFDPDNPASGTLNTLVRPGDVVTVGTRGVYFVAGEVNRPGIYSLGGTLTLGQGAAPGGIVKNLTLLDAVAQAGGITSIASRSKLHILRTVDGKREEIMVDETKLSNGQVADPILQANDIVYIPPSYIRQQTNNLFATAISGLYAASEATSLK